MSSIRLPYSPGIDRIGSFLENVGLESDTHFIDAEIDFCVETAQMCSVLESEHNDPFVAYATFAFEADDGETQSKTKRTFGQKVQGVAKAAWEKIKAFFRRIRNGARRILTFLRTKGQQLIAKFKKKKDSVPMTAEVQKVFKLTNGFVNPAMAFMRKGQEAIRTLDQASKLAKNTNASEDAMNSITNTLNQIKEGLSNIAEKIKPISEETATLADQIKEKGNESEQKIVGKGRPNTNAFSLIISEGEKVTNSYDAMAATFENGIGNSNDENATACQKMCVAAAGLANTFLTGNAMITKVINTTGNIYDFCSGKNNQSEDSKNSNEVENKDTSASDSDEETEEYKKAKEWFDEKMSGREGVQGMFVYPNSENIKKYHIPDTITEANGRIMQIVYDKKSERQLTARKLDLKELSPKMQSMLKNGSGVIIINS